MRSKIRSLISIIRLAGLAVAGLGMWVFATIAEGVLGKQSYAFDSSILLDLRSLHTPLRDRIMLGFTFVGEPNLLLASELSLGIILLGAQSPLRSHNYCSYWRRGDRFKFTVKKTFCPRSTSTLGARC